MYGWWNRPRVTSPSRFLCCKESAGAGSVCSFGILLWTYGLQFPLLKTNQTLKWEGVWRDLGCLARTASFAVREESGHSLKSSLSVFVSYSWSFRVIQLSGAFCTNYNNMECPIRSCSNCLNGAVLFSSMLWSSTPETPPSSPGEAACWRYIRFVVSRHEHSVFSPAIWK